MHKPTLLTILAAVFIVLVIPAPYTARAGSECFTSTSLASELSPHSYVEGRPFFGTYENREQAVQHAQRIGACVEPGGFFIHDIEPELGFALKWEQVRGYAVMGRTEDAVVHDRYRFVWKERRTGLVHHSRWFDRTTTHIRIDAMVYKLNALHVEHYVFWVEMNI